MGHLYHGYVSHNNQRVTGVLKKTGCYPAGMLQEIPQSVVVPIRRASRVTHILDQRNPGFQPGDYQTHSDIRIIGLIDILIDIGLIYIYICYNIL
jgi:hypothetical protein